METDMKQQTANGSGVTAEPKAQLPAKAPLQSGGRVAAIVPGDIESVYRLAQGIARAGWAPKSYMVDGKDPSKGYDPDKIAIGILHGLEVGFTPMAALQSIAVINGTPSVWGDGLVALVRSSGMLVNLEETIEGEGDARVAVCTAIRRDQKTPIMQRFSVADAKAAGLWGKQGPWQNYRDRMMQMRARSWCLRDGFADVLKGLGVAEEVMDRGELVQGADGVYSPAAAPVREPTRDAAPAAAEEFELVDNDGKITTYTDPKAFTDALVKVLDTAGEVFDEQWQSNVREQNVLERLRALGRADLIERINAMRSAPAQTEQSGAKPAAETAPAGGDFDGGADAGAEEKTAEETPPSVRFWFIKARGEVQDFAGADDFVGHWLAGMDSAKSLKGLNDAWMRNAEPLGSIKAASPETFARIDAAYQEQRRRLSRPQS